MIPKAVEDANRAAEELIGQLNQPNPPADPQPSAEPVLTTPSEPPASGDPQTVDTLEYWKNRFKTLEGKYTTETKQALRESADYRQENALLRSEIIELKSDFALLKKELTAKEAEPETVPDEIAMVEKETPEVSKYVDYRIKREVDKILKRVDASVGEVTKHVDASDTKKFFDSLTIAMSNWREVNNDPEFLSWLKVTEKYSRKSRHELLKEAVMDQDVHGTVSFFKDFLAEKSTEPAPAIDKFASPPKPGGGKPPAPKVSEEIVTRAEVRKFYADLNKGLYRGKEKEAAEIESRINKAMSDGRIR